AGNSKSSKSTEVPPGPPMYLDLVYIPNHSNRKNVDVEFFKRVRSSYYVVSGNDSAAEEPSRAVLDSLLEGKAQWDSNMQVGSSLVFLPGNVIFSGKQLQEARVPLEWAAAAGDRSSQLGCLVSQVLSTVVMQDESFPACKIEL
ncbi:MAP1B protein, partial [Ploceus nigricollis]|nr:MAP1B protein [Ploceus nigricollis]